MAARHGTCRACGAAMLWAAMPSGRLNPRTGKGLPVIYAVIGDCQRWAESGVTFHTSHFATCPARERFKRSNHPQPEETVHAG